MKPQIRIFILKALARAGQPMTESALIGAVMMVMPECLVTEIRFVLRDLELNGFIAAAKDELTGSTHYGLTMKGTLKTQTL